MGTRLAHCKPVWRTGDPFSALGTILANWVHRVNQFINQGTDLKRSNKSDSELEIVHRKLHTTATEQSTQ